MTIKNQLKLLICRFLGHKWSEIAEQYCCSECLRCRWFCEYQYIEKTKEDKPPFTFGDLFWKIKHKIKNFLMFRWYRIKSKFDKDSDTPF